MPPGALPHATPDPFQLTITPDLWQVDSNGVYTHTAEVSIDTLADDDYEGNETFSVYLGELSDTAFRFAVSIDPLTVTINDSATLGISDISVATSPTNGYYVVGDVIEFLVTFNISVQAAGSPVLAFDMGGQSQQASYARVASTKELVFAYTVSESDSDETRGVSWPADSLELNGGSIKIINTGGIQGTDAVLSHDAQDPLPGHKVDASLPTIKLAVASRTKIRMTFSEELGSATPDAAAFTMVIGSQQITPDRVSIEGDTVVLTTGTHVSSVQAVSVSYAKPQTNRLEDVHGNEAAGFTSYSVSVNEDITGLTATPGDQHATVSWTYPNISYISKYQYRYRNTRDSAWNPDWTDVPGSGASTTRHALRNLTNNVEYTIQVRPVFTQNQTETPGKEAQVRTIPRGALLAPSNLVAIPARTQELDLSWDYPGDITIAKYQHRYRLATDSVWNPDWRDIPNSNSNTTTYVLKRLHNRAVYVVEVRAARSDLLGPAATVTAAPLPPLDAPRNFTASSTDDGGVNLGWDASDDESITDYQHRYRVNAQSQWIVEWSNIPDSTWETTSHTVDNLDVGTEYLFEVRALRGSVEGPSSSDTATPKDSPSAAPAPDDLFVVSQPKNLSTIF